METFNDLSILFNWPSLPLPALNIVQNSTGTNFWVKHLYQCCVICWPGTSSRCNSPTLVSRKMSFSGVVAKKEVRKLIYLLFQCRLWKLGTMFTAPKGWVNSVLESYKESNPPKMDIFWNSLSGDDRLLSVWFLRLEYLKESFFPQGGKHMLLLSSF